MYTDMFSDFLCCVLLNASVGLYSKSSRHTPPMLTLDEIGMFCLQWVEQKHFSQEEISFQLTLICAVMPTPVYHDAQEQKMHCCLIVTVHKLHNELICNRKHKLLGSVPVRLLNEDLLIESNSKTVHSGKWSRIPKWGFVNP